MARSEQVIPDPGQPAVGLGKSGSQRSSVGYPMTRMVAVAELQGDVQGAKRGLAGDGSPGVSGLRRIKCTCSSLSSLGSPAVPERVMPFAGFCSGR